MAEYTRQLVKQNGCEEVVTVLQGRGEDIELPEKVDVLVSEWMGTCLVVNGGPQDVCVRSGPPRLLIPQPVSLLSSLSSWWSLCCPPGTAGSGKAA